MAPWSKIIVSIMSWHSIHHKNMRLSITELVNHSQSLESYSPTTQPTTTNTTKPCCRT